jgi:hypothetical protein
MEKSEFLKFYKLLKDVYNSKYFSLELKQTLRNKQDLSLVDFKIVTTEIYEIVMSDERPLMKECELKLAGDNYLAPYSKYCSEYVRGIRIENLVEGNTYPDLQKSIEKVSLLLKEYLIIKLRNIKKESDRKTFLLHTDVINKKFKDLIKITEDNTVRFLKKVYLRYGKKLEEQDGKDKAKYEKRKKQLKENFEVVSYNIWRYLTKEWMQKELLRYFDLHTEKLIWLSEGYLASEMLVNQGNTMKNYMDDRLKISSNPKKMVRTLTPVDSDEFYPGVNTGIDL